jgi:hypothetical protein
MATFVLTRPDVFPPTTSVGLYAGKNTSTGLPTGSVLQTQTVAGDGTVTFTSLNDSTTYYAYAASPDRIVQFSTPAAAAGGGAASSVTVTNFPGTQPVSGTVTASGPLTDTQLRATALPVSGTVAVSSAPTTAVTGPVTDTQLRASAVPVSGTVTVSSAPTTAVTGPVTDTQLRATALPVSGTVAVSSLAAGSNTIGSTDTARYSSVTTTTPTVAITSGTLIASSGSRKLLFLMNVGTVDVWARDDGSAATIGAGVFLPAGTGSFIEDRTPTLAWTAIADGGSGSVTVREYS